MNRPLLLACLLLCVRCGARTELTASRNASTPIDAATGACRWTPSAAFAITPDGQAQWRVLAATSVGSGAHIALQRTLPDQTSRLVVATALDDERASPRSTLSEHGTAPVGAAVVASVAATPAGDSRWALFTSGEAPCVLVRQSVDQQSLVQPIELSMAGMGFTLSGCRSLGRTSRGLSFLSEQLRALWGAEVLSMNEDGRSLSRAALPSASTSAMTPSTRVVLEDRSFVLFALDARAMRVAMRAQRFDQDLAPRGANQVIAEVAIAPKSLSIVETNAGLLALWDNAVDTLPPVFGFATRVLDPTARPIEDTVEHGELGMLSGGPDATTVGAAIVATGRFLDGTPRQRFFELDDRGRLVGAPIDLPTPSPGVAASNSKIVATNGGALVLTEISVGPLGGQVIAIPVRCAR